MFKSQYNMHHLIKPFSTVALSYLIGKWEMGVTYTMHALVYLAWTSESSNISTTNCFPILWTPLVIIFNSEIMIMPAVEANIFLTDKDQQRLKPQINLVLDKVDIWFKCNKLSLIIKT